MDSEPAMGSDSGEPPTWTTSSVNSVVNDMERRRGDGCSKYGGKKEKKGGSLFGEPKSWI
ncbi:hypothetical protein Scep_004968 [Stephania cephalantha]|uniref:Uncharacterized protein n=1 Tax=Stephania cephalantha TaxID=152367 RepID=A0AAP0PXS1_9MAGN